MDKFLVTGGAGFIGSNFIRLCLGRNHKVLNYDLLTYAGNLSNLKGANLDRNYQFVKGDISDNKLALLRSAGYKKFLLTRIVYHPLTFVKSVLNILRGVAETKAETHIRTLLKKNIGSGSDSEINVRLHPLQVIYVMLFKIIPVNLFNKKESQ